MLTQEHKRNYIVHYRLLKFYLTQGMILKKIHRVISFKQSKWLKPYIEFNTNQRTLSKTDFEKDYFKLLNNSFFGKTCENIRNRKDVKLVNSKKQALKLHANPRFRDEITFDDNIAAIMLNRTSMKFDKPIYIGCTVLELSKLLMYKFYYNVLQLYFGEKNIEVLYMDTDSFILKIKTQDLEDDLYKLQDFFDFSKYPQDHKLFNSKNKKVPGKFKDELGSIEMTEFIALRSKMYAYKTKEKEDKN